jgi:chaperone required for assembly of F1-ATPase
VKRFYRQVAVLPADGGIAVCLDGRPIKTPDKAALELPTAALAEAVADEWRAQEQDIDPLAMPFTRLANTAIDRIAPRRAGVIAEIVAYGGSDLVCYRVAHPADLAARQAAAWQPLLDWLAERHGARLESRLGVVHKAQPQAALEALAEAVQPFTDMELAAVHSATSATGSLVLALALAARRIDAEAAFAAGQLDEAFQAERWGEDDESVLRRAELRADLAAAADFLGFCRD